MTERVPRGQDLGKSLANRPFFLFRANSPFGGNAMRTMLKTNVFLVLMIVLPTICFSQTDPKNVPQPPTVELKKFDPFLGRFNVSGEFAKLRWTGTLECKRAIKGWYVELTILIKTEGIDREFLTVTTWDKNAQKFRMWRFQTLPVEQSNEGEIRFEGNEMITQWVSVSSDVSQAILSNRYRKVSDDQIEILSYMQVGNGPVTKIGVLTGKRLP
jgi:hypothetical protein